MRRAVMAAVTTTGLTLAAVAPASALDVEARGNIVTGGLAFAPLMAQAHVGDVAAFKNVDFLVPHTATEEHGLWDLGGGYGNTGITPPGFGPGQTAKRVLEASTVKYYCRVHPMPMRAVIAVPVDLTTRQRSIRSGRRTRVVQDIVATWAAVPPAAGEGFDVQYKRANGDWVTFADGTTSGSGALRAGVMGTITTVRARLRSLTDPARSEGWSPDAAITSTQAATKHKRR
jgi:plastocyanin